MFIESKIKAVTKELSDKLKNKEITSKELFECLEEVEKFKAENGISDKNWSVMINV